MSHQSNSKQPDPLGLERLERVIASATPDSSGIDNISSAFQAVMNHYTALQDRYRQLKASNHQLAEEVAWLRDQCDDFAMNEDVSEPDDEQAPKETDPKRRLEDRR